MSRPAATGKVEVTTLGMGGAPLGNLFSSVSDYDAQSAVEAAWLGGVRYFDTAPHYGLGLSERRFASALSNYPRAEFAISTKVGRLLRPNPHPRGSDLEGGAFAVPDTESRVLDYSPVGVRRSIEESLERLQMDFIDIAYVHDPDNHLEQVAKETLPALAELRDEGLIGAIGVGMNYWQPLLEFVQSCSLDVVMVAGRWTLLDRSGEVLLNACAERGVCVVAAAPFNSGVLAQHEVAPTAHFDYAPATPHVITRVRDLAGLCSDFGVTLPHAALQFPLRHRAVVSVVAGFRGAGEARSATQWMSTPVPQELWTAIDEYHTTKGALA